ncbi:DUF4856 domain-containing protein [Flavobacteriaceae bacterium MHTCC 0001]
MKKIVLSVFALGALFTSCSSDDDNTGGGTPDPVVVIPSLSQIATSTDYTRASDGSYDNDNLANYSSLFTRDGKSTVSFSGQTTRLKQAKEIGGDLKSQVTVADIQLKFEGQDGESAGFTDTALNGTTKIVRAKTSSSIGLFNKTNESGQGLANVSLIDDFIEWHQTVLDDWATTAAAGQAGTFLDADGSTRYVTAKGYEVDQLFTKSLAGALAYDQAVNHYFNRLDDEKDGTNNYRDLNDAGTVAEGKDYTTMEHHWDEAFGYIYGNTTGQNLIYKYIDNVDGLATFSGIEKDIFEAFATGRIAIVEKDYTTRDAQIAILREKLGVIIAVRAVHYLVSGAIILEDSTKATEDSFHDLCEGYGFVNSLRYLVKADGTSKYFTDAEVDGFLATLDSGNGLWDVTPTELRTIADDIAEKGVGGSAWSADDVKS